MHHWRERLAKALQEKGLDMKQASMKARLNAAAVQQIVKGNNPKATTLQAIANANELSLDEILLNRPPHSGDMTSEQAVKLAPVVGTVSAGIWFLADAPPQTEYEPVPYVPCRFPELEQKAYRFAGQRINGTRIEDGDYVITVPYWDARLAPVAGDIVVVEQTRDGGLVELSLREIEVTRETIRLMGGTADEKGTVVIRRINHADMYRDVKILALVVGRFAPI